MCEAGTIAAIVIAVAGAVAGGVQASEQASMQEKAIKEGYRLDELQRQKQLEQINKSAADKMSERARQAAIERARLRVVAGESGIAGISPELLLQNNLFQQGYDVSKMEANRKVAIEQANLYSKSAAAQYQTMLNSIPRPNYIQTGLQIASIGVDAYNSYQATKAQTKTTNIGATQ